VANVYNMTNKTWWRRDYCKLKIWILYVYGALDPLNYFK